MEPVSRISVAILSCLSVMLTLTSLASRVVGATDPPPTYTLNTFAGPNLAEGVHALDANLWLEELALRPDGSLLVGTYANRGFVRELTSDGLLFTVAGKHARDLMENEGGLALETDLGQVTGLAVGESGDAFLSITRQVVCRIDPDGRIYKVAGTWGVAGQSGDGGLAVNAVLDLPRKILLGDDGTLFFSQRRRVSRVDPDGFIWTVAGGGMPADGLGDGGLAIDAALSGSVGLALDSAGRMYIADSGHSRIRRVELDGTISTFAGNGNQYGAVENGVQADSTSIGMPLEIVFDEAGALYFSDGYNHLVRKIATDGVVSTIAGTGTSGYSGDGGPAVNAQITEIRDLLFDADGNLVMTDQDSYRLRSISPDGVITTIGGNGTQLFGGDGWSREEASFSSVRDVAIASDGSAYIADYGNCRIRKVDPTGTVSTLAGTGQPGSDGDGSLAVEATLTPEAVARGPAGEIYVAGNRRVRVVLPDGSIEAVAGTGDTGRSPDGTPALEADFHGLSSIELGQDSTLYLVEADADRIRYLDADGLVQTLCGTGVPGSSGDGGPAALASINEPRSVFVHPNGEIYLTEYRGHRVRRIGLDGIITTIAGNGVPGESGDGGPATNAELWFPYGVVVDEWGAVYISCTGSSTVRRVLPSGVIETIAGNGELQYLGDGMPALETTVGNPGLMELGPDGSLLVASFTSGRMLQLVPDVGTPIGWHTMEASLLGPGRVRLSWIANSSLPVRYEVYRRSGGTWSSVGTPNAVGPGELFFVDTVPAGHRSLAYRVDVIDGDQLLASLGPVEVQLDTPARRKVELLARPNPFNPRTSFDFTLPRRAHTRLRIFNMAGRLVRVLADEVLEGEVRRSWDGTSSTGREVASGVYIAELRMDGVIEARVKVSLVR